MLSWNSLTEGGYVVCDNGDLLNRLRNTHVEDRVGDLSNPSDAVVIKEWKQSGVKFVASTDKLENTYYLGLRNLLACIVPMAGRGNILHEGGAYLGCWLESTGTINTEILMRFLPSVADNVFSMFADFQRQDGLMPYKVTPDGPAFKQIQLVTPLARSVWNHYALNSGTQSFLRKMYEAMCSYDLWLSKYRNTRKTGCIEAFCTFDTGHDLSPRFWHVADTPHLNDPTQYNPDSPILPFLAPDLTASVYCQRLYLAKMADELGYLRFDWRARAKQTADALFQYCYDDGDGFFYDVDRNDQFVRVQSDVLLRVLACEIGDGTLFDRALSNHLLNTRKFFSKYPFTSIAMDDPRYDPASTYNTWGGTSNFLSLIRAPHAFEFHNRFVELTWILQPIVNALSRMTKFGQNISPWTGSEGYTETYSPAILCLLDFVERLCGILPTPDGMLWFTGLLPYPLDHGEEIAAQTAYSRTVDGVHFELVNTRSCSTIYRNGKRHIEFPHGTRVVTDRHGNAKSMIGMSVRRIMGNLRVEDTEIPVSIDGNEELVLSSGNLVSVRNQGVIVPTYQ